MPGYPIPCPKFQAFTDAGAPLVGGKLYTYAAGGLTPLTTYADQALSVPNANPVILDGRGEASIFVEDGVPYRIILKTSADVEIWDQDDVEVPETAAPPAPASSVPAGSILPYGGAAAPTGFLLANGAAVSRATYADLFTAIGTSYGVGDGSTTFNIPDMRGRFPLGKAAAGTGSTLGATGGSLDHTHSLATHTHALTTDGAHTHAVPRHGWGKALATADATGTLLAVVAADGVQAIAANGVTSSSDGSHTHTATTGGPTATGAANPPFAALNFIVKT